MQLNEVTPETEIVPGYRLTVPQDNFLIVVVPYEFNHAGAKFKHKAIVARSPRILEYKHTSDRRKWWTQEAGVEYTFVIPQDRIEVVAEHGYSYPKLRIDGHEVRLNVSGGTDPKFDKGWRDIIRQGSTTQVNIQLATLKAVAEASVFLGLPTDMHDIRRPSPDEARTWMELVLRKTAKDRVRPGDKLFSADGFGCNGYHGPFKFFERIRQNYYCSTDPDGVSSNMMGAARTFDWLKSAETNGWELPAMPPIENYIGKVLPSYDEELAAFYAANSGKPISVAAWGPGNNNTTVPDGFVGVAACVDGTRGRNNPTTYWLVPKTEYDARDRVIGGIVIDPQRHQTWVGPNT
jgi:hypothetical protein